MDSGSSKQYIKAVLIKILFNNILRTEKYKELAVVLERFQENSKKDIEGGVKNFEHDHIFNKHINFCKMIAALDTSNSRPAPDLKKLNLATPSLSLQKSIIDSYLSEQSSSSFVKPNRHLI